MALLAVVLVACNRESPGLAPTTTVRPTESESQRLPVGAPRANVSALSFEETFTIDVERLPELLSPLIDLTDQARLELASGAHIDSAQAPDANDQLVLSLSTEKATAEGNQAILVAVPSDAVRLKQFDGIMRTALELNAEADASGTPNDPLSLSYSVDSPNGGMLALDVEDLPGLPPQMTVRAESPTVRTTPERLNRPALDGSPLDHIRVVITTAASVSDIAFLADRALGLSAADTPPVRDVSVSRHGWAHVSTTRDATNGIVSASVDAVTDDGRFLIGSGSTSMLLADNLVRSAAAQDRHMREVEASAPGTSAPWATTLSMTSGAESDGTNANTFDVSVSGGAGQTSVKLDLSTTFDGLDDVDPVAIQGVTPKSKAESGRKPTCSDIGAKEGNSGVFQVQFAITTSLRRVLGEGAVSGNAYLFQWEASDLAGVAPRPGTTSRSTVTIGNLKFAKTNPKPQRLPNTAVTGVYDFTGFLDRNLNADPSNPVPDTGDLLIVPVSGYELVCDVQPITVEFGTVQT